jgi:hypothetical protein
MAGLGFFDERVQLPGMGVRRNFLIPKRFAVFQQPISHSMNFPGFKLCDGGFNFLHGTHGGKLSDWRAGDKSANEARGIERFGVTANGAGVEQASVPHIAVASANSAFLICRLLSWKTGAQSWFRPIDDERDE